MGGPRFCPVTTLDKYFILFLSNLCTVHYVKVGRQELNIKQNRY